MSIKVTDRRMFTEDGQLRDEYRDQVGEEEPAGVAAAQAPEPATQPPPAEAAPSASDAESPSGTPEQVASGSRTQTTEPESWPPGPQPGGPGAFGPSGAHDRHPAAQFLEIVHQLVEPAMLFLGEAPMPDGQEVTDLERARVFIDLLAVLEEKTQGNLTGEEERVLSDVLYQLRMRYVQKQG